jgi:hypothetical protein
MNTKFYSDLLRSFDDNKGSRIFPVIFVNEEDAEDTRLEFWLADTPEHVEEQLISQFKEDWDMPEDVDDIFGASVYPRDALILEDFKGQIGITIMIQHPIAEKQ